jgi:hypothetical protein
MDLDALLIVLLVGFSVGLMIGVSISRPNIMR